MTPVDLDLDAGTATVRRTRIELLSTAEKFDGPPKTAAGYRSVAIPPHLLPLINEHLAKYAGGNRMFVDRRGEPMRGDSLRQAFERARTRAGLPHLRFHDLRIPDRSESGNGRLLLHGERTRPSIRPGFVP